MCQKATWSLQGPSEVWARIFISHHLPRSMNPIHPFLRSSLSGYSTNGPVNMKTAAALDHQRFGIPFRMMWRTPQSGNSFLRSAPTFFGCCTKPRQSRRNAWSVLHGPLNSAASSAECYPWNGLPRYFRRTYNTKMRDVCDILYSTANLSWFVVFLESCFGYVI